MAEQTIGITLSDGGPGRSRAIARALIVRGGRILGSLWMLAVFLVVWELLGRRSDSLFFPPISRVAERFIEMWMTARVADVFLSSLFWEQALTSLSRFAQGWAAAVVVGILCGLLLGSSPILNRMYAPGVRFFAAIPNTMLLPIAVQIFGVGSSMNVFLIFLGSVWVIMINTCDGVAGVDRMWLDSARSMRMSRSHRYRLVILPAASPQIMAGLRVSLGIALILMVISEMYATTAGLGHQIVVAQSSFRYLDMWSAFVLIGLIGIALNLLFGWFEKRLLRWQQGVTKGE